jgi:hypothetical protein
VSKGPSIKRAVFSARRMAEARRILVARGVRETDADPERVTLAVPVVLALAGELESVSSESLGHRLGDRFRPVELVCALARLVDAGELERCAPGRYRLASKAVAS